MSKPNLFTLNRNYVLTTTDGRSILFEKGVPTHVPPFMVKAAVAIGATPQEGEVDFDEPAKKGAPTDPSERESAILDAVEKLATENERDAFTAAGTPKVKAVEKLVDFSVDAREVQKVWNEYQEKMAASREQAALDQKTADKE